MKPFLNNEVDDGGNDDSLSRHQKRATFDGLEGKSCWSFCSPVEPFSAAATRKHGKKIKRKKIKRKRKINIIKIF